MAVRVSPVCLGHSIKPLCSTVMPSKLPKTTPLPRKHRYLLSILTVVVYDKLQMLHAAHNLQDVTSQTTNVLESSLEALAQLRKARTRPAQLPEFLSRAQSLAKRNETLYVQESRGRFSISESELDVLSREIPSSLDSFLSWALSSLQPISLGLGEPDSVSRAKAIASPSQDPGNTSLLGTFNSSHGLSLVLSNAWDKLV